MIHTDDDDDDYRNCLFPMYNCQYLLLICILVLNINYSLCILSNIQTNNTIL